MDEINIDETSIDNQSADQSVDRRDFLTALGRYAGGTCAACALACVTNNAWAAKPPRKKKNKRDDRDPREVRFYEKSDDGDVFCHVCPNNEILSPGETGLCHTRTNVGGRLVTQAYDNPCILKVDPVEKLPFNHFRPGSNALTIAVGGCNLRCRYCQNYMHSQKGPTEQDKTFSITAEGLVKKAKQFKVDTIAFGYTEPIAYLEYATEVAKLAKRAGLRVIAATGLYVHPEPLLSFAKHVDAFTVGLKGFTEDFYRQVIGAELKHILTAIKTIKEQTNCWLELVNLVVPTYNDDIDTIRRMTDWVYENTGPDTPLHFERFTPMYQLKNLPRTSVQVLEAARQAGLDSGLRYVYTSNIAPHEGTHTYCHKCGTQVIQRLGFKILEDHLKRGVCQNCRTKLPGQWT